MRDRGAFALLLVLLPFGMFSTLDLVRMKYALSTPRQVTIPSMSAYENVTLHEGDLTIDGTQTLVIENCTYIQTGNIHVRDNGTLVMRDAELFLNQSGLYEYSITVKNNGKWSCSNVSISSNSYFAQSFDDNSRVDFTRTCWTNFTWIYGSGSFLYFVDSNNSLGDMYVFTQMLFVNSSAEDVLTGESSDVTIENSTMLFAAIGTRYSELFVDNLGTGHISAFNTFKNVTVASGMASRLKVFDSDMSFSFHPRESNLTVRNSTLWGIEAQDSKVLVSNCNGSRDGGFSLLLSLHSEATVYDSYLHLIRSDDNSSFNLYNCAVPYGIHCYGGWDKGFCVECTVGYICTISFRGILKMDKTVISGGPQGVYPYLDNSTFYIEGDFSFPKDSYINSWKNNAVTRNFNIILLNGTDYPVADVNLSLQSPNKTLGWNRVTDDFGKASFNLTFTDTNYTDSLRLEAVEGNYSALTNIDFLSSTPVVLKMRYYTDLNGDGVVNIVDISIAAKAFGSKLGDSNWNQTADLNKEGAVNIVDIAMIAKDYGKTV